MPKTFVAVLPQTAVIAAKAPPVLFCFSHLRWDFVYQRPQHLLSRAAAEQQVYFMEEPRFERTGILPRLDLKPQDCGVVVAVPVLPFGLTGEEVVDAQRLMLDELHSAHASQKTLFWYYTPMALEFSDHLAPDVCLYDCMDELSAFHGASPRLKLMERKLMSRCDLVFTGGRSLYEAKRDKHAHVHAFASSIDKAHFGRARGKAAADPVDQAALPGPRIGFFGVIDERMDLDLIDGIAAQRPDWQMVMIGPVVKINPASLPRRDNIHWLGPKAYQALPDYLSGWDAGFMPFAINASTRFISPTKTPEFLAAGVPVVSTPIRDVVQPYGKLGLVEIASDADSMIAKLEYLLERPRQPWLKQVDKYLADLSWDVTWTAMNSLLRRNAGREGLLAPALPATTTRFAPVEGAAGV